LYFSTLKKTLEFLFELRFQELCITEIRFADSQVLFG